MAKKSRSKRRRATAKPSRTPWIAGAIAVGALIIVPIVIEAVRSSNLPGDQVASQGNRHIPLGADIPAYNSNPPTSGPHTDALAAWGSYGPDDPPPDQMLIHNMEDGGVVIWYRPPDDPAELQARLAELESVASGYRHVVIAPRADMPSEFALTAWQRLERFDEVDEDAMRAFLHAYEGVDHHAR